MGGWVLSSFCNFCSILLILRPVSLRPRSMHFQNRTQQMGFQNKTQQMGLFVVFVEQCFQRSEASWRGCRSVAVLADQAGYCEFVARVPCYNHLGLCIAECPLASLPAVDPSKSCLLVCKGAHLLEWSQGMRCSVSFNLTDAIRVPK